MYTHQFVIRVYPHIWTLCLRWSSGKHRGFCIVTNRDSVLLESYFWGRIDTTSRNGILMFLCTRVSEFHSCLIPFGKVGQTMGAICVVHIWAGSDTFISLSGDPISPQRILYLLRYIIIKCEINILNYISKDIVSFGFTRLPTGIKLKLLTRFSILIGQDGLLKRMRRFGAGSLALQCNFLHKLTLVFDIFREISPQRNNIIQNVYFTFYTIM